MTRDEIKAIVKADLGGVMAISPARYCAYLDDLSERLDLPGDEVGEAMRGALDELPPIEDW